MNFGETIKKLRRQKDMTQEQLAEYLNISTQAVSRWETNSSLPDITLIPMIANIFDVTTDMLLGVDIDAKEKRIQDILDHADKYWRNGYNEKAAEILREGVKEYPNSYKIMRMLMHNVWHLRDNDNEENVIKKEVISIGEKILAECTDDDCRHTAIQLLCYTYPKMGETEKAIELAEKMPTGCLSRENLLGSIYSGDKGFEQKRLNIFQEIGSLILDITCNTAPLDDGSKPYTTEELIIIYKKALEILEIIFDDGNYGFYRQNMSWSHIDIARFYAQLENYDSAIENLKIAAEHSIKLDEEGYNPDGEYTTLILKGMKFQDINVSHNVTSNDSMHQLEQMKDSAFDPIRENRNFIEIEEKLKEYAKKR